ncbi:MAG: L-serine ammonia-lyase, iron-sulfur-dependent, subunit alpha [Lachnospiraceae bacterium]|nr:L-serine ammonia-lyase, iron-sulfur-dependent, subunit alpha [Lachnospiraceae bacterium]
MFHSLEEIKTRCVEDNKSFYEVIALEDAKEQNCSLSEHFSHMKYFYGAMKDSDLQYQANLKSHSGLVGTEAEKVRKRRTENGLLCGEFTGLVMEKALRVSESNACMKRIVAAPTAGSCGVVPATLVSFQETYNTSEARMVEALYVAAGIGGVIASRATLSGAEGGCQAEIGSASAMAAGALVYLMGGDANQIIHGAAIALKGLLGLACDPVAGLVEVPCVKRNVIGAINAVSSADLAMSGVFSRIPPDEVIDAMKNIGRSMSPAIRETGAGGLAATPTGRKIAAKLI